MSDVVYLDVCCLKRPFDDQRSTRVQLETATVAALIDRAEREGLRLVRSPAHGLENNRNPREDRRLAASIWLEAARVEVPFSEKVETRAREILGPGLRVEITNPIHGHGDYTVERRGILADLTLDQAVAEIKARPSERE